MSDGERDQGEDVERALEAAARTVYARYQREIVEGMDFCPYALRAREDGAVRVVVCLEREPTHERVLAMADALAQDSAVEIGLVLFPRVFIERLPWQRWVGELHALDAATPRPLAKLFAAAAFHPDAEPDTASPARLVSFIRRTPDPTIQLVRLSVLQRMRSRDPAETTFVAPQDLDAYMKNLKDNPPESRLPLHERIARANLETVRAQTTERVQAILDDILRARDEAYAPLGVAPRRAR